MNSKDHGNSHHKDNWEDGQLREGLGGQTGTKGKEEDKVAQALETSGHSGQDPALGLG